MLSYILRRVLYMIPTLIAVSFVSFLMILLYEHFSGSYVDQFRFNPSITPETMERLEESLGLNLPWYERYVKWVAGALRGDFGVSFQYKRPVADLFWQYLPYTLLMTIPVFLFIWIVALPIGIYSATHKYSIGDHTLTFLGFLGLSIPNFFLALIIIFLLAGPLDVGQYGLGVGGIFQQKYMGDPRPWTWSWGKFVDYLWHMWPVVLVLGTSSLAGLIRVMRGQMLDILGSNYVQTARSKGLAERVVIYKHAVRNAVNPMISIFGQSLQFLISGALVTAIVLNIPTVELLYFQALQNKDEYLILTILTFFAFVLLFGNLLADILLALVDPRIRYD
jgi:peptide/nickel transport system permease protein